MRPITRFAIPSSTSCSGTARRTPTVNDVTFFSHYRQVHHRDGTTSRKWAPLKKTIYSLAPLHQTLIAANKRYLRFISAFQSPHLGLKKLHKLTHPQRLKNHTYKGFNLLAEEDTSLLRLLARGEWAINGFTNKMLRQHLTDKSSGQVSRLFKRLRLHGLIKKVAKQYKYYLTSFGRQVVATILTLREMVIIPVFAFDLHLEP